MMLDKLESEWAEVNKKLPPSIEEACQAVDHIQVCYHYWSSVILLKKLPPSIEEACQAVDHIQVCYHYWSSVILLNLHLPVIMRFRYELNE